MKQMPVDLLTYYRMGSTNLTTCWRATLTNGTVVASTTLDTDLVFDGLTYRSTAGYTATSIESSSELNPDNLEVDGFLASPSITTADIYSGLWDHAAIEIFELDHLRPWLGVNMLRSGNLGEVRAGRDKFNAELRGMMQRYSKVIGRLTTKDCTSDLGDARCKVSLAAWTVTGTVGGVTNNRTIADAGRGEFGQWFAGGKLTFTSGLNAGVGVEVKTSAPGSLELVAPAPFAIAVGDTYSVYAGCGKRFFFDCVNKFNNGANFQGFPHLPGSSIYKPGGVA
jgi:uncharacterized phage protein (TIGR02218 family)